MTPEEGEVLQEMLHDVALKLGEYFDSVQIHASLVDEMGTHAFHDGKGDFFARRGLAHEFLSRGNAELQALEINKEIDDTDDDDESWKSA